MRITVHGWSLCALWLLGCSQPGPRRGATRGRPAPARRPATEDGAAIAAVREAALKEASPRLKKLAEAATVWFEKGQMVGASGVVLPALFPPSLGLWPRKPCCGQPQGQCRGSTWEAFGWKALNFEITGPHRCQYQVVSTGENYEARFTVRAVVDLNCRGRYLILELSGRPDKMLRVRTDRTVTVREARQVPRLVQEALDHAACLFQDRPKTRAPGFCLAFYQRKCAEPAFKKVYAKTCAARLKKLRPARADEDD
jgi:hypothetical protein